MAQWIAFLDHEKKTVLVNLDQQSYARPMKYSDGTPGIRFLKGSGSDSDFITVHGNFEELTLLLNAQTISP